MNQIIIEDLKYENILDNISLKIKKNQFITVSGPNNSGKTTLLRVLNREIIVDDVIIINNKKINEYKIAEYEKTLQCVIPLETKFQEKIVEEELYLHNDKLKDYEEIIKGLKIRRLLDKRINSLELNDIIKVQLAIALLKKPKILLIDNLTPFFEENELIHILEFLKSFQKQNSMIIIYNTINLQESLYTDYLYIISDGCIALEGKPIEVLEKDNIINKIGLNIPFMIDLSVKLRDYDLLNEIELDMDRMVEKLWN